MHDCIIKTADAYEVKIFIGINPESSIDNVIDNCIAFCSKVGLCVTVTQTVYAFKGGASDGVIVGLINYARFPKSREEIWETAIRLGFHLKFAMGQGSFTVQDDKISKFFTTRVEDGYV